MDNQFLQFSRYLFIFAHPDDEIYTCCFIQKLVQENKNVEVLYVTSGDYQGLEFGPLRETEIFASMRAIGLSQEHIHLLRVSERKLLNQISEIKNNIIEKARELDIDCIVGHDFEGGHNGHDAISFCSSTTAEKLNIPFYVFPAYHKWPKQRLYNQFVSGREETDTLMLSPTQHELKEQVIGAHKSQEIFFNLIKQSSSRTMFFSREIVRRVLPFMDYTKKPTEPVGYEYPGSKLHFEDFKNSIAMV